MNKADERGDMVEISGSRDEQAYLGCMYDPERNMYFAPELAESDTEAQIKRVHTMGYSEQGVKTAVLDTGMMLKHPLIAPQLMKSVDFTGIRDCCQKTA